MNIDGFLDRMGLDDKESRVFLSVVRLGAQPASIIAKHVRMDRTTTYRILQSLYKKGLLSSSVRNGTTIFYLDKLEDIAHYIGRERDRFDELKAELSNLKPQLSAMRGEVQGLPRIQIYDGFEKLQDFFRDIVSRTVEQKLIQIRILGSNTFSQQLERNSLGTLIKDFQADLKKNKIEADILIAQGNLTREWLTHLNSFQEMANLPAAGGATNVILVGESVFMASFRDFPVGIRIDHPDIAHTMHFLFDLRA